MDSPGVSKIEIGPTFAGGFRSLAKKAKAKNKRRPAAHWKDPVRVVNALMAYLRDPACLTEAGYLPTARELREAGREDLRYGISVCLFLDRISNELRRSLGRPSVWSSSALSASVVAFWVSQQSKLSLSLSKFILVFPVSQARGLRQSQGQSGW